jgi:hypothetical protein
MTAEQQAGYHFLVDGPLGRLPGPYRVWVHNPALVHAVAPLGNPRPAGARLLHLPRANAEPISDAEHDIPRERPNRCMVWGLKSVQGVGVRSGYTCSAEQITGLD